MYLFLKRSVLQANFCWVGDVEEMICPWEDLLLEKDNLGCLRLSNV